MKNILRLILTFFYNILFRDHSIHSLHVHKSTSVGKNSKIMNYVSIDKYSEIGHHTYIGHYTSITKTKIGNFCSIASNVRIGHGDHDINSLSTNSLFFDKTFLTKKNCIIKNDVWIGTEAIISRGVTIGNGAIIGANSFVNKDIPDYSIAVGSPAKIIKYRFDDKIRQKLQNSKWWNIDDIQAIKKIFDQINSERQIP